MVEAFPNLTEDERIALVSKGIDVERKFREWLGVLLDVDPYSTRVDTLIADGNAEGLRVMAVEDGDLTDREKDVLALAACGLTADEIADEIHLSADTVKKHSKAMRRKLGARNTTHAVTLAIAHGIFDQALAA